MIHNLVVYLVIGTIVMFLIDFVSMTLLKEHNITFNNKERITVILLWPILALGVMVGRFKRNNDE